jgi:hypothetical protein
MEERKKMTFKEQLLFILGVCGWMCFIFIGIFIGIPYFLYEIALYLYKIMGNSLYYILGGIGLLILIFSMIKVFLLAIKTDWNNFDDVSMRELNGYQEPPKPICLDRPSTPCPSFVSSSMPSGKGRIKPIPPYISAEIRIKKRKEEEYEQN